jgi:hypothetical protein
MPPERVKEMAWYKYEKYLSKSTSEAYDSVHQPGSTPPHSGIYKCTGCGHEIVAEESRQFPPQNHHQHSQTQGAIRWKLIVFADHESTTT